MLVHNKHGKIIGGGPFTLLPGETAELPKGYDKNHPVIAFFLEKGYLIEAPLPSTEADVNAAVEKAKAEAEEKTKAEAATAKAEAEEKLRAALGAMSLEELQAEAKELGLKFNSSKDTAETLIQKIVDKNLAG